MPPDVEDLVERILALPAPPRDRGELRRLVVRPARGERLTPEAAWLTVAGGVEGDRWAARRARVGVRYAGRQVTLIRADIAEVLCGALDTAWTGDNLQVWLDATTENLPSGSRLRIGADAVLEVSAKPHTGCRRFRDRFGEAAGRVASAPALRGQRVRGMLLSVVADGLVQIGDPIVVVRRGGGGDGG